MPKNIYVVGAQCTGKTTLVAALQARFQSSSARPLVFTEVARTVLREHKFTASDITSSKSRALRFQELILEAQYETEKAAGTSWFISDRSGFDPIVYTKRYVGDEQAELLAQTDIWQELKERMSHSLVLVCEAGANWLVDDGTRLMPVDEKDWVAFHDLFCDSLKGAGLEYTVLPCAIKNIEERVQFVMDLLDN